MCVTLQVIIILIYTAYMYIRLVLLKLLIKFFGLYLSNLRASHFPISQTLGV